MSKKEKKQYPLRPYIIGLLITVIMIVLLSYFAQQRNNNIQMSRYGEQHSSQIEEVNKRIDAIETRLSILENESKD
ncbi:MAG: hypothetical protein KIG37_03505 [Oscillospiraceae bacterium]|nr:hypothetical protein [Oscillospiraceae bacterium]